MKKGYVITIVCLLLALCVLGGLIYFDLFHGKDKAQEPMDIAKFEQAMQDIEDSKTIGNHLRILTDPKGEPELFRYDQPLTFTVEVLKENKAALLHTTLKTEHVTHSGYYELYYEDGWKPELTDGKPVMIVEETTYHYDKMDGVDVIFGVADHNVRPTAEQMEAVKTIIEKRLVAKNIGNYEAYVDAAKGEIHVRFPWADSGQDHIQDLLAELTVKGTLQFYEGEGTTNNYGEPVPPADTKLILDGNDIQSAEAMVYGDLADAGSTPYVIALEMTDAGKTKFATATQRLIGSKISIWIDRGEMWAKENIQARYVLLQTPTVENAITDGEALITGFASYDDAKEIADMIASDALPFEITVKHASVIKAEDT